MDVKDSILALFDDNITGAISAADMRIFVDAVFDSKENEIHVFDKLSEITNYRNDVNTIYPINQFDLIVITDNANTNEWGSERGIYIALKTAPGETDVFKVGSLNYDEFIKQGTEGQLISLDSNKDLVWINPIEGYFIEGTDTITNILAKRPSQKGPIWIASDEDLLAPVPGKEGDGYSWTGSKWINIGPLRGPAGDVVEVAFASQYEVDAGYIDYKAISPLTFKNSSIIKNKENSLGNPTTNGYMLISDTNGRRSWEKPVKFINDLLDVDYSIIEDNSVLIYNSNIWSAVELTNIISTTWIGLSDTPSVYTGFKDFGVVVNSNENGLTYRKLVTKLADLNDVSDSLAPQDGYVLKYNAGNNLWVAMPDNTTGITASRPSNPQIGTMYFDISIKMPVWFDGIKWIDANGQQR